MRPFQCIADLENGGFAILSVDPTQRVDGGCGAIVLSVHDTRDEAERALNTDAPANTDPT